MEDLNLKYIKVRPYGKCAWACCGDDVSYSLNISNSNSLNYQNQILNIYNQLKDSLQLTFKNIETVNYNSIQTENEFLNMTFQNNGSVFIENDIQLYWFDYIKNTISEICLPKGCKLSIYKNDNLEYPISIVLRFYFNLFSNNLVSVESYGKYEKELYYFKPAARINRAIVRNAILELKIKHPEIEIEFNNEIGWLSNFDEFGFTEETDFVFD
ncbi:MAG TPA: hypothetical protein PKD32_11380 [Saprospiraceae bacterium]|nr:hypothetical protein [Saprospiraceae bacterium]